METLQNPEGSVNTGPGIFAQHAPELRRNGLAVLPANGKSPTRKGFSTMKRAPGLSTVERWAEREPDADIVVVPGLSQTANGCEFVILDADDMEASDFVEREFGKSNVRVKTRKGVHHWFELPGGTVLGGMHSLRGYGLNIDVKHGQGQAGIVVAPPSRHTDQRDFRYELLDGADAKAFRDVRPIDLEKLIALTDTTVASKTRHPEDHILLDRPPAAALAMRDGSRRQWLNDRLCRDVSWVDSFDELLDCARTHNASLVRGPKGKLDDAVVVERATEVWKQRHKFVKMDNRRATALTDADEIRAFASLGQVGQDAHALVQLFRAEHGARVAEGSTFQVRCEAMARAKVLGKWSPERYRRALKVLLTVGLVVEARPAAFRRAAEYTLGTRIESPAICRRGAV